MRSLVATFLALVGAAVGSTDDPAFSSPDTYVGPGGITWLHRWALTREVERSFFQGEPTTAVWVQDLAGFKE